MNQRKFQSHKEASGLQAASSLRPVAMLYYIIISAPHEAGCDQVSKYAPVSCQTMACIYQAPEYTEIYNISRVQSVTPPSRPPAGTKQSVSIISGVIQYLEGTVSRAANDPSAAIGFS